MGSYFGPNSLSIVFNPDLHLPSRIERKGNPELAMGVPRRVAKDVPHGSRKKGSWACDLDIS
jgi:hypothetical protein